MNNKYSAEYLYPETGFSHAGNNEANFTQQ